MIMEAFRQVHIGRQVRVRAPGTGSGNRSSKAKTRQETNIVTVTN